MEIRSKSSGWWPAAEAAFAILAGVLGLSGCGGDEKPAAPPAGSHWTAKYQNFGGQKASAPLDANWKEYLDRPVLGELKIVAPSVSTALAALNEEIMKSGGRFELPVSRIEPGHPAWQTEIRLEMSNPTIADAIDRIVGQAKELAWEFREKDLVILPESN